MRRVIPHANRGAARPLAHLRKEGEPEMRIARYALIVLALGLAAVALSAPALAQHPNDVRMDSPIRALEMGPREVRADLVVDLWNNANERRPVKLILENIPQDWNIGVWDRFFDFKVGEVIVEPQPVDSVSPSQTLRLRVDLPDPRPPAGDYSFGLRVVSPSDNVEYDSAVFTITVPEPPASADAAVSIITTFPVLRGTVDSTFNFEIVIENDTGADSSFSLESAVVDSNGQALSGWEIDYTPSFGEERLISSISVADALSERVDVRVTPPRGTNAGDYFVPVRAYDEAGFEATTILQVTVRGTGDIITTTDTGRLNIDAVAGESAAAKFRITNIGTAELNDISLVADAPQGWEATFEPSTVSSLPAANLIDIPFTVLPAGDAIPGDYLVTLRAVHPDTVDSLEIRVTVAQSTIWGWLGIVLVVLVIGGLAGLFWRLGRR